MRRVKTLEEKIVEREQTTIRLPQDLKAEVQQKADEMGISFNEFVMSAINLFIDRHPI